MASVGHRDPAIGRGRQHGQAKGAGRRRGQWLEAIRSVTSAVRSVIARSWGTKPSRVTRIVYVPGANAIPGRYCGRILVICTVLSAGVGSTVRRKRRGG